ncbi:hypothetical protein KDL01_15665 [Actinospica durhamensis]|uniref:Uncharacterized protein n=1 Tax=Actinospica durhamensis TaxID=1508375 RepID=A0A941EQK8_9ACTN|nr:hypothetical protein [Actinospica durhamensis]MBR7834712.1 hypothetical protein [Actinospica durhamensis]
MTRETANGRRPTSVGRRRAYRGRGISLLRRWRRGGLRSHRGPGGPTYRRLYAEAGRRGVEGRSKMNKSQLGRAAG